MVKRARFGIACEEYNNKNAEHISCFIVNSYLIIFNNNRIMSTVWCMAASAQWWMLVANARGRPPLAAVHKLQLRTLGWFVGFGSQAGFMHAATVAGAYGLVHRIMCCCACTVLHAYYNRGQSPLVGIASPIARRLLTA